MKRNFKNVIGVALSGIMILSSAGFVFADSTDSYDEIRLVNSVTHDSYTDAKGLNVVVEGKKDNTWSVIANNDNKLAFKSLSPAISVSATGAVTVNTSGTGTIIANYTNPDGSIKSGRIQMIGTHYNNSTANWNIESFETNAAKTNEQVRSGEYSVSSETAREIYPSNIGRSYMAEMWFYDDMQAKSGGIVTNNNASGTKQWYLTVGINNSDTYYYKDTVVSNDVHQSEIKRSAGWHQVVVDPTLLNQLHIYVDGVCIYTKSIETSFDTGMWLLRGLQTNAGDKIYYDDFNVYKSTDGRPIAYNVRFQNVVCDKAFKNQKLVALYDFYAPCRDEGDTTVSWRDTSWAHQTSWTSAKANTAIEGDFSSFATMNDVWLRIKPVSTATSSDYNTGAEARSDTVYLVGNNAGVSNEIRFFGKSGTEYSDITAAGLSGEKTVCARLRVLNASDTAVTKLFIGAKFDSEHKLLTASENEITADSLAVSEKSYEFTIDNDTEVLKCFVWKDFETLIPMQSPVEFDYSGIK